MKKLLVSVLIVVLVFSLVQSNGFAHQSSCHRWHSCPSDTASYTCGDKGYCSECHDNYYCKDGKARLHGSSLSSPSAKTKPTECNGSALCIVGKINKVIDGDTIIVQNQAIRLSLTNAPEKNDANFMKALDFAKQTCPVGSVVIVDQDDKQPVDKYKRIIGKVTCSGKILNAELLYNGHAHILKQYCSNSEFATESWAKKYGC